ncbi:hypothetical protein FACS1894120_1740 [Clostridia bacterium]|nr:hypothetical protein FACS1894120_1740 [Clostridia bacterium]
MVKQGLAIVLAISLAGSVTASAAATSSSAASSSVSSVSSSVSSAVSVSSSAVVADDLLEIDDDDVIPDTPVATAPVVKGKMPKKVGTWEKPSTKKALLIKYKLDTDGTLTISPKVNNPNSVYKQSNGWFANYGTVLGKEKNIWGEQVISRYKAPWDSDAAKIKKIVIKDGVSDLPNSVFVDLPNLKEVTIEPSLYLWENIFVNCPKLAKVNLPQFISSVGDNAAVNCPKLKPVLLNITYKYDKAAKSLKIFPKKNDDGEFSRGLWYAFGAPWKSVRNDIKSVELAEGFKEVPNSMFKEMTSLTTVKLPESLEIIGSYAFETDKKLKTVVLPKNLERIDSFAFKETGFTSVHLKKPADGVDYSGQPFERTLSVSNDAYAECPNLKTVTVDSGVTIEYNAFRNNAKLTKLTIADGAVMNGNSFVGCEALQTVVSNYVFSPSGNFEGSYVQFYGGSDGWGTYADKNSRGMLSNRTISVFTSKPENTKTLKIFGGKNIKWASTNKSVASVDSKGKVKGLKEGFSVIYAKSSDGSQVNFLVAVYSDLSRRIMNVQKDLPDGYYWNTYPAAKGYKEVSSQPCTDHPTDSHSKGQCAGYGYLMVNKVFKGAAHKSLKSAADIKAGTYIRMTNGSWAHSLFIVQKIKKGQITGYDFTAKKALKSDTDKYIYTDCNWDRKCGITWGGVYTNISNLNLKESFNSY